MMQKRSHFIGYIMGVLFALSPIGIRPAGAQSLPELDITVGRAHGTGNIIVAPGQSASFRFQIDPLTAGLLIPGQVQFVNRITNERVISQRITSGFIIPGLVSVEGICTINGRPSVFQMEAFDAFTPAEQDNFFICYGDAFTGSCVGGFVVGGTVTVEQEKIRRTTP